MTRSARSRSKGLGPEASRPLPPSSPTSSRIIGTTGTGFLHNDPCWRTLERMPQGDLRSPFYLHLEVDDRPGVLAEVAQRLSAHGVSVARLDAGPGRRGRGAPRRPPRGSRARGRGSARGDRGAAFDPFGAVAPPGDLRPRRRRARLGMTRSRSQCLASLTDIETASRSTSRRRSCRSARARRRSFTHRACRIGSGSSCTSSVRARTRRGASRTGG